MYKNAEKWLDLNEYPFKSNYITLTHGDMHYIDEGEGEILLFVHGTPTWSFVYRKLIQPLSKRYRCIAMDHLGFGLSSQNQSHSYKPEDHAKNLDEFITKMNLKNISLVVHDFGGPIGLSNAINQPELFKRLVVLNTWLWGTNGNQDVEKINQVSHSFLGKFLFLKLNFSPKVLLKQGFLNKKLLTKHIHQHYIRPFSNSTLRRPLLILAQSLLGSSDFYEKQWNQLKKIENKPWLFLWGDQDKFINTSYLNQFLKRLPKAQHFNFNSGHFIQEEKPEELAEKIDQFCSHN